MHLYVFFSGYFLFQSTRYDCYLPEGSVCYLVEAISRSLQVPMFLLLKINSCFLEMEIILNKVSA